MKKLKLIIFIILIITFIIILFCSIFGTNLSYLSYKEIKKDRILNENLVSELKINDIDTIYEKKDNIYYYMIPDKYEGKNYNLKLYLDKGFKYKIIGETLNIIKVDYNKLVEFVIYNDKYYYKFKVQLTNLPLVNILTKDEITTNDTKTQFNYINSNNSKKIFSNKALMHVRGATSKKLDKKAYKINFTNKNYSDDKNVQVSNFYFGDSLILDSVQKDPSKIRNVLSIELWNDISNDFSNIDVYSEFVEVFINNEYNGLYVLTEPINRKKLKLNKSDSFDTSIIIKTVNWLTPKDIKKNYNVDTSTYLGYEMKYPNDSDFYEVSWDLVLNKLSTYYNNPNLFNTIEYSFNIKNYIDLIIFNAFINNSDNKLVKNNYFYMNSLTSKEIYIQPWDMEYSYGLDFSSNNLYFSTKKMDDFNILYTEFFLEDCPEVNSLLIDRYWELRKIILNKNYFNNLLNNYKNDLIKGGALRDSNMWYEYDVEKEIEDIRNWIYNRLEFFDDYVKELETNES